MALTNYLELPHITLHYGLQNEWVLFGSHTSLRFSRLNQTHLRCKEKDF